MTTTVHTTFDRMIDEVERELNRMMDSNRQFSRRKIIEFAGRKFYQLGRDEENVDWLNGVKGLTEREPR